MKKVAITKNELMELIPSFSEETIGLCENYFKVLQKYELVSNIEKLMQKIPFLIEKVVYYSPNDKQLLKKLEISSKCKGLASGKTMYVNDSLDDELKEITFYHELTHLLQSYGTEDSGCGVMVNYKWRLIMEAQTQNLAELVYSDVHGKTLVDKSYDSGELRMISGVEIKSSLRNYQMYDSLARRICSIAGISMLDLIRINFLGSDSCAKFEEVLLKRHDLEWVENLAFWLDQIISTDLVIYCSEGKGLILEDTILDSLYCEKKINVSSKNQLEKFEFIMKKLA